MLLRKFQTARRYYKAEGWSAVIELFLSNVFGYRNAIDRARLLVGESVEKQHNNTVAYGPFKGMKMQNERWLGALCVRATKLLGTYERQVTAKLAELSQPDGVFIDIGAADGYFAVGAIKSGLFSKTYAFEILAERQEALKHNAMINGVADKMEILGEASIDSLKSILSKHDKAVVLIDIEGSEFTLLDDDLLSSLRHYHIIIEMHDPIKENGAALKAQLIERASPYFDIEFLKPADVEVSKYPELASFKDSYRLLAFSEGRRVLMEWAVFSPKAQN